MLIKEYWRVYWRNWTRDLHPTHHQCQPAYWSTVRCYYYSRRHPTCPWRPPAPSPAPRSGRPSPGSHWERGRRRGRRRTTCHQSTSFYATRTTKLKVVEEGGRNCLVATKIGGSFSSYSTLASSAHSKRPPSKSTSVAHHASCMPPQHRTG